VKGCQSIDDFDIKYNSDQVVQIIDQEEIDLYIQSSRLVRSEHDIKQGKSEENQTYNNEGDVD